MMGSSAVSRRGYQNTTPSRSAALFAEACAPDPITRTTGTRSDTSTRTWFGRRREIFTSLMFGMS